MFHPVYPRVNNTYHSGTPNYIDETPKPLTTFGCIDHSTPVRHPIVFINGETHAHKYPNYYGYGVGNEFHYGEPYYIHDVESNQ